jgi:membrane-bound serine protease (ClpP class)
MMATTPRLPGRRPPSVRDSGGRPAHAVSPGKSLMSALKSLLMLVVPVAILAFLSPSSADAQEPKAGGVIITVQNPISGPQIRRIKADVDKARRAPGRNVKKVVFDFNPEGKDAATEDYGPCSDLADYIVTLTQNGLTPIAFVHGKVTRHTVLPVIACEDIVMSSSAQLGEVWTREKPVTEIQTMHYLRLAGIARSGPVLKMIDKDVKLVQAIYKTRNIHVDLRKVDGPSADPAYSEVRLINKTPIARPAAVELYNLEDARKFGLCNLQAESRAELKQWYDLPDDSDTAGWLGDQVVRPVRIVLEGTINTALREKVRRQIESAKARKENTFFFVIETTGGDPSAARAIADDLIALGKDTEYRAQTIAFVPGRAPDVAVFLAFACGQIVMYKGPAPEGEAVIGDFDAFLGGPNQKKVNDAFIRQNLEAVADEMNRSKLIVEGLFDRNLVIVRARNKNTGDRLLMSEAELKQQADQGWQRESVVKEKGALLRLNASRAKDLGIAQTIDSKDIGEVYALYGIEGKDVRSSEPSWLDDFSAFLRQTPVSILLVIIGIAGLVLELKAPGLIVPGVISAICFVLFFWAQTQLGGQLIYLAIMLFLLGIALLGIEIFVLPGFGVAGVSGILLVLAGLVLAGLDKAPESTADWVDLVGKMLRYGLTMAGAGILAFILSRYLPKIPYANRLMLVPPEDKADLDEASPLPGVDLAVAMLGQVGTATSMLRPSGMAKFGDRYIDVVSEGDFISPGTPIQVVEVEGTRIVVKRV